MLAGDGESNTVANRMAIAALATLRSPAWHLSGSRPLQRIILMDHAPGASHPLQRIILVEHPPGAAAATRAASPRHRLCKGERKRIGVIRRIAQPLLHLLLELEHQAIAAEAVARLAQGRDQLG